MLIWVKNDHSVFLFCEKLRVFSVKSPFSSHKMWDRISKILNERCISKFLKQLIVYGKQ